MRSKCWTMSLSRLPLDAPPVPAAAADATAAGGGGAVEASGEQPPELLLSCTMEPVLLSDPLDEGTLTDAVKFCRRQIEFFTADPEDVDARYRKGGVKQDIYVGQVGIRCVHCARLGKTEQPNGSVSYPASISLVYQAVRNWQSEFVCCIVMFMCYWILHLLMAGIIS